MAGGWYQVVNRGNQRESIIRTDTDRRRVPGRLAELPQRFRVEINAFVLMDNHHHLLVRIRSNGRRGWRVLPTAITASIDLALANLSLHETVRREPAYEALQENSLLGNGGPVADPGVA